MVESDDSKKYIIIFAVILAGVGIFMATVVFPFWNLIREEIEEETVILSNYKGKCTVNTSDKIPKTIDNCSLEPGTMVTIKYGKGLAWASIVEQKNGT